MYSRKKKKEGNRKIAILGSTGSIGTQALEVIRRCPNGWVPEVLTAQRNAKLLIQQALEFQPNAVVITDEQYYGEVRDGLRDTDIKVYAGKEALQQVVEMTDLAAVLVAIVGIAALLPTVHAIEANKFIFTANKETLVVAGDRIVDLVYKNKINMIPIDSEHSAIYQCLAGESLNPIEQIYLTASGGPFRKLPKEELEHVSIEQALNHPNWEMGSKITVDSASLMNKGLEAIEAKHLFGLQPEQIKIIIHPQSIIHSMVQFQDGSIKAQMGLPDMKLPIQYAMNYPYRIKNNFERFNFMDYPEFTFEAPDTDKFPCIDIAFEAMKKGGNAPCIMNAANEKAVEAFLNHRIKFTEIPELIQETLVRMPFISNCDYEQYLESDQAAKEEAERIIQNK